MTNFKILSHACMFLETKQSSIIIDPWLVGSCYWRSWWNFPQAAFEQKDLESVDCVIVSHVHWDHWHGATLKKFFKGKSVITANDPNLRSVNDLKSIGFDKITKLNHGKSIEIGDIKITFYNFGLYLTDSAIVIETPDVTILNANDAKLAGSPLKNILKRHKKIDFAMRSHSSANSRICHEVLNEDYVNDDREHYFRSFKLFMDTVKPKYAIPFASNHCHLNYDGMRFNSYISDPIELRSYLKSNFETSWSLKVMLPGSSWNSDHGFKFSSEEPFLNKMEYLSNYQDQVKDRLDFYKLKESKLNITEKVIERFRMLVMKTVGTKKLLPVRFKITSPDSSKNISFIINSNGILEKTDDSDDPIKGTPLIIMPNIVFRDSVVKNMFHHAAISKRCRFIAFDNYDMQILKEFYSKLERYELTGDINFSYICRLLLSYRARWRELIVYFKVLYYQKAKKLELFQIEEKILKG